MRISRVTLCRADREVVSKGSQMCWHTFSAGARIAGCNSASRCGRQFSGYAPCQRHTILAWKANEGHRASGVDHELAVTKLGVGSSWSRGGLVCAARRAPGRRHGRLGLRWSRPSASPVRPVFRGAAVGRYARPRARRLLRPARWSCLPMTAKRTSWVPIYPDIRADGLPAYTHTPRFLEATSGRYSLR